ncbi:crotonase/enoyl-CoA hydratase family protein [Persicimonas caeni]|uniref:Crotonase/enoyl-CoA hydratase family protein n=1 Tax=Persicimonas caeni TaxID=2292766 RepID=A0A4Y6PQD7_PERCE|nr:crotonase/enoyl-CoA hydratase family protein [Persicimonas caeni]QDG50528.1 crotonase/enoyl-CoA hydratase family protein [Persicimonas caeni]QED31749.1 crotonase/enoyl-CoA hydratase family protein [Persicimonas caeni]
MSDTKEPRITTERRDHLFLIGLNRPAKMNAFDRQMLRELAEAYTAYEEDDQLWCAVVFPHGEHTTSGLDLGDVGPAVAQGAPLFPEGMVDPFGLREPRRSKPVIMAARGWCLTIGLELMLASDIRLAAPGTKFAQIEIKRGIFPFGGGTLRLPQVAGWGDAMRYLLTGDEFEADEARRMGVVQEVVEADALVDRAVELGDRVASQAPLGVQATLETARVAVEDGQQAAAETLLPKAAAIMQTEDAQEGLQSFLERREANFKGR